MNKLFIGTLTAAVMFTAQPAFSAARVAVLHLAPFASDIDETALFLHSGGGSDPDAVLTTERVGTIDFDLVDCVNATAMVTLDGQMTETFNGVRLTQPMPCTFE